MKFTVSDTKGSLSIAMAPLWLGQSPIVRFSLTSNGFLLIEDRYILEFFDYDKKADLRWDTFKMTLDDIDFTGLFLDRVTKHMTFGAIKLEPTDFRLHVIFGFASKEVFCDFFFEVSGQLGSHITDYHGYSASFEYPLNCK